MKIISYHYTNVFKQLFIIACMVYFLLCGTVIVESVVFEVPGYSVNIFGFIVLYVAIFAILIAFFLGYKFCYTLYDDETLIYYNKLLRKERSIDLSTVNKVVLGKRGVNLYANGDLESSAFFIPFFRGGIIEAIEIDNFYKAMKAREDIHVIKDFTVLPGYGKGFTALKVVYVFLAAYTLLLCATPFAAAIVLFQHFM